MARILNWILRGIGFVTPWLIRAAWAVIKTMVLSLVSTLRGVSEAIQEIADEWLGHASVAGFPTEYDQWLYSGAQAIALVVIVIGWILWALLTTFVLGLIF